MPAQPKNSASPAKTAEGRQRLEFLVVCKDQVMFKSVAAAVRLVNGRLNCTPKVSTAGDYLSRRRIDGIVVDMGMPGALELIRRARGAGSNRASVVFACMGSSPESQFAIRAGANFVLHRPLLPEKIAHIFTVASGMMSSYTRRYFRYPLMVPVQLELKNRHMESTMANVSEGGMAVWSLYYQIPGSPVQFAFEIPSGEVIRGRGEVAWTNADGLAGIKFHILPDQAYTQISGWIAGRDLKTAS